MKNNKINHQPTQPAQKQTAQFARPTEVIASSLVNLEKAKKPSSMDYIHEEIERTKNTVTFFYATGVFSTLVIVCLNHIAAVAADQAVWNLFHTEMPAVSMWASFLCSLIGLLTGLTFVFIGRSYSRHLSFLRFLVAKERKEKARKEERA